MGIYITRQGDTLAGVARRFSTSEGALAHINQLSDPLRLTGGLALLTGRDISRHLTMEVNACVYPGTASAVLAELLPVLTYASFHCCLVSADGALSPPQDDAVRRAAVSHSAAPILTVANITSEGAFSGGLAHSIVRPGPARERFMEELTSILGLRDYLGVNICFEYLYPYDQNDFSELLHQLAGLLHSRGKWLFCSVPPKSREGQSALSDAYDYGAVGAYADRCILLTFDWGSTYTMPQPVSPLDGMRRVLDYALPLVPASKLLLGFSHYGYKWALPWRQGQAASFISAPAAADLAVSSGATVSFDSAAMAPYFYFTDASGRKNAVYYEDVRTASEKLRLAEEYYLKGISLYTAQRPGRALTKLLSGRLATEKII